MQPLIAGTLPSNYSLQKPSLQLASSSSSQLVPPTGILAPRQGTLTALWPPLLLTQVSASLSLPSLETSLLLPPLFGELHMAALFSGRF